MSKTILITGTSSGLGKAMAVVLAGEGHTVIATMRNVNGNNAVVAGALSKLSNIKVLDLDVTSTESVNSAIEFALHQYGQIDVLINNAGISGLGLFEATSVEQMKSNFEVNLWGTIRCIQAVLPSMREHTAGLIINISSILGVLSTPYLASYSGAKHAMEGITESLHYEIRKYGIEAVTVLPGSFPTAIGSKEGQGQDKPEIIGAYGEDEFAKIQKFGVIMSDNVAAYNTDNREVAEAVKKLIDMPIGSRPQQTLVNRIAGGVEQELFESKNIVKAVWMKRMRLSDL